MANANDIKKVILKQIKALDVPPKEAKRVADACAKLMAKHYKNTKKGKDISKALSGLKVKAIKGRDGKKTIKVRSGEMRCMPRTLKGKVKSNDTLRLFVGHLWAFMEKHLGKSWEEQEELNKKKGNGTVGVRG